MSWEQLFEWKPLWEYTASEWLMTVGIVIGYMVIRYYLYKFNIVEPRYKKELRKFHQESKEFCESLHKKEFQHKEE
jgi:predicted ferric reductase